MMCKKIARHRTTTATGDRDHSSYVQLSMIRAGGSSALAGFRLWYVSPGCRRGSFAYGSESSSTLLSNMIVMQIIKSYLNIIEMKRR